MSTTGQERLSAVKFLRSARHYKRTYGSALVGAEHTVKGELETFCFSSNCPPKDGSNCLLEASAKKVSQSVAYEFRTDLAESGALERNGLRETE